jgi:hypothetical protein
MIKLPQSTAPVRALPAEPKAKLLFATDVLAAGEKHLQLLSAVTAWEMY